MIILLAFFASSVHLFFSFWGFLSSQLLPPLSFSPLFLLSFSSARKLFEEDGFILERNERKERSNQIVVGDTSGVLQFQALPLSFLQLSFPHNKVVMKMVIHTNIKNTKNRSVYSQPKPN
eukprot:TRINITY_DN1240_c0_g3_i1.p2 TRINITY_DN1240_c0_g3~~TRINITY_DN1240_c0_g3_i1.p2  ORF type:complete len:120 (+),score=32.12 TRINITY_DN1240_c0_g3_i1:27-386(+)